MVTLVDAPGHANLIKSVLSSANIIDIAFLVIDALQGPQVQTGEHLILLDLMKIQHLFVLINKIDLISEERKMKLNFEIKKLMKSTRFDNNFQIFEVSAKENKGFTILKEKLLNILENKKIFRDINNNFQFLI